MFIRGRNPEPIRILEANPDGVNIEPHAYGQSTDVNTKARITPHSPRNHVRQVTVEEKRRAEREKTLAEIRAKMELPPPAPKDKEKERKRRPKPIGPELAEKLEESPYTNEADPKVLAERRQREAQMSKSGALVGFKRQPSIQEEVPVKMPGRPIETLAMTIAMDS